jgi:anti-sigma B factor antagonist
MSVATFNRRDGVLVIELQADRLDAAAAPGLKSALEVEVADRPRRVILDCRRVGFLDSTGLGVFVSLLKMMGKNGGLAVAGAQPAVARLLKITQLDQVFRMFGSVDEAEAALRG